MVSKHLSVKQKTLLKRHLYILRKLASSNAEDKKIILENAPLELFKVLNLIFNLLVHERLQLNKAQTKKLKRYKSLIHTISGLKGQYIKRKLMRHRRSILTTILTTVLPLLGGLVASI